MLFSLWRGIARSGGFLFLSLVPYRHLLIVVILFILRKFNFLGFLPLVGLAELNNLLDQLFHLDLILGSVFHLLRKRQETIFKLG